MFSDVSKYKSKALFCGVFPVEVSIRCVLLMLPCVEGVLKHAQRH